VLNALPNTSVKELHGLASVIEQQAERLPDAARGAWLKLAELVDPTTGRLTGAPRGNRARSGWRVLLTRSCAGTAARLRRPGLARHGAEGDGSAPPLAPGPVVCCPRTLRLQEIPPSRQEESTRPSFALRVCS
jgi:hypothetical protein